MAKIILSILLGFLGLLLYQNATYPQVRFNAWHDRLLNPFDLRLRYRVAPVDPRFKLSQEQLIELSEKAIQIWTLGTGKQWFVYDPNAQLVVELVYDERQEHYQQQLSAKQDIEQRHQNWLNKNNEIEYFESQIQQQKLFLDQKKQQLNTAIQTYEFEVSNAQTQHSSETQRQAFNQRKLQLEQRVAQLQQEIQQYNQHINKLQYDIGQLNQLQHGLVTDIQHYNQTFQPRLFDKGIFNGKSIQVYQFKNHDDLILTLAHEFGHALGLEHHQDPAGLMHPMLEAQQLQNFQLNSADLSLFAER